MKKIITIFSVLFLLAAVAYSQTSIYEVEGFLQLRPLNPQIRVQGTLALADRLGAANVQLYSKKVAIVTTAATRTLTAAECGSVIVGTRTSTTQIFTLPAVSNAGCQFTFMTGHADSEIQFLAAAAGTDCVVTAFAAVGTDADTGIVTEADCETGVKNTAATNAIGDSITIVSDGTRWLGVGISSGIWAVVT